MGVLGGRMIYWNRRITMPLESALVVLIPEAEHLVDTFRKRYDPSAAIGIPAHVTVLYPFKNPDELTSGLIRTLRELFSKQPAFTVSFPSVQRFPDTLYLMPEPAEPFRQLTEMIVAHFPDRPPYGGAFADIVPHLTIAQGDALHDLDKIEADFRQAAMDQLPFLARVNTVAWMDNASGDWEVRAQFSLHNEKQVR
jgi:2'-5' RNA ligase